MSHGQASFKWHFYRFYWVFSIGSVGVVYAVSTMAHVIWGSISWVSLQQEPYDFEVLLRALNFWTSPSGPRARPTLKGRS